MYIPRTWTKATGSARHPQSGEMPVAAWGFGEDAATARSEAASRLKRLIERITRGEPFPDRYTYGAGRPPREEILRVIGDAQQPAAVITRNCGVRHPAREAARHGRDVPDVRDRARLTTATTARCHLDSCG